MNEIWLFALALCGFAAETMVERRGGHDQEKDGDAVRLRDRCTVP